MSESSSHITQIAQYRVLNKIGEGGMGEVYLAHDTKLGRKVALKLLPIDVVASAERLNRFEREAQAASALNQPNIITIHEIGNDGDTHFIVTEFVEGETVRQKLRGTRLEVAEAIDITIQIVSALKAAHELGIVHRDIKPENIMVRTDGLVKVLDFGLAKLSEPRSLAIGPIDFEAETQLQLDTAPGIVLGTLSYMSPEQARGKVVDARSDIFSCGIVLYEMLVGRSPFSRETMSDVIAAILTTEPPAPGSFNQQVPLELDRIVTRALQKNLERRYQNGDELLRDLRELQKRLQFEADVRQYGGTEEKTQKVAPSRNAANQSIAVLPFTNVSDDPQMDYLSDGLTESVLFGLSQLPEIQVVARSAVFRYKGSTENSLDIGRALHVGTIVTGRVRQQGAALLITAELIEVESGWQLWCGRYKRATEDLFDIEDEIANEISQKLRLKLTTAQHRLVDRRRTDNTEAYHLYLKGKYYWGKRTEESLYKALQLFRQAIDLDPTYALAYAGLAEVYAPLFFYCHLPPKEAASKAKAAAERALEIEPELPEALALLAPMKSHFDWDVTEAESLLRRAVTLDPKYPRARQALAEVLTVTSRFDEALEQIDKALELDPLSLHMNAAAAMDYYYARRYTEAIKHGVAGVELDPSFYPTYLYLGLAYQATGQFSEAVEAFEKAQTLSSDRGSSPTVREGLKIATKAPFSNGTTLVNATLACGLAAWGKKDDAKAILEELDRSTRYVPQTIVSAAYAALGKIEESFTRLERACDEHCPWLRFGLTSDARFDCVRGEKRFAEVVARVAAGTR